MKTVQQVAQENDALRRSMAQGDRGRVLITSGVAGSEERDQVIEAVRNFDSFTGDNDPHQEHDFGQVIVGGQKYFFKIDYYEASLEYGADPMEDEDIVRVLTIMRADEY